MGESGSQSVLGMTLPTTVAIGGATALASLGADVAHDTVFPLIPSTARYAGLETAALGLGTAGAATAFILNQESLGSETTLNAFLLGAGSYAAGDWIDGKFFSGSEYVTY